METATTKKRLRALQPLTPDLHERAWSSSPHPTLPLLSTAHARSTTVFSLTTLSAHSTLQGGHTRSVRSSSWKPGLGAGKLCLVTGSFDSTAGLWRWEEEGAGEEEGLEREITAASSSAKRNNDGDGWSDDGDDVSSDKGKEWEFTLVLEGHDSEIKSCAFSPAGNLLATSSRDKSVWIWEDIGPHESADEWETVAVLTEHEGDVKSLSWCPATPGRDARRRVHGVECLASASYDDTVRVWREDQDAEWVCVAVLEGHAGTVWGVEWEGRQDTGGKFPRCLSFSADGSIKVWTLQVEDEDEDDNEDGNGKDGGAGQRTALGGIPNTMRRSIRETWTCTATLPPVHKSDVYSATWSATTGLVASTGSDGVLALYRERRDGDSEWEVLETVENAHGPFEVNSVAWCKRWDSGIPAERRGVDEMLVTTGDDGVVRPWEVEI
ncbi:hypothetical protein N3K66_006485 [Trichothecium roseum]|uniref:Uncharacterized protein n=1 Tax=Trichothecium roseum TaxID=47278 RepID=A0ACC0UXA5_9HYPO|nr:hypothetical protein N3K66_006485 [Trichothecium roseum]